jgi:hypothetical protein
MEHRKHFPLNAVIKLINYTAINGLTTGVINGLISEYAISPLLTASSLGHTLLVASKKVVQL